MVSIRVLTQNLGGQIYEHNDRVEAFLTMVKEKKPDVIAVQGCSRFMFEPIMREMGLMGYKRFLPDVMVHRETGEAIFSKIPFIDRKYVKFPQSKSNKGLTYVKLDVWEGTKCLWICTSDMDTEYSIRNKQIDSYIELLLREIPPEDIIVFAGTTHILEYHKEIMPNDRSGEWEDVWYEVGKNDERYTLDHTTNLFVQPPFKDRPDRVWVRGLSKGIEAVSMSLFKAPEGVKILSPHYGVLVEFELE